MTFTYVGAPLLILARAGAAAAAGPVGPDRAVDVRSSSRPGTRPPASASAWPTWRALDYPPDRLEVDRRLGRLRRRHGRDRPRRRRSAGSTVLDLERVGKADALNAAVAVADGEIVVFTDANTAFAADALRALVRPFADPTVGGVAGNQVYESQRAVRDRQPASAATGTSIG